VQLERYAGVDDFLAVVGDFLSARQAAHNLLIGISYMLRSEPRTAGEPPYLAAVLDGDRVVLAAIQVPPRDLVLSEVDDPHALERLVNDRLGDPLPGVSGPVEHVGRFARLWSAATGEPHRLRMAERIFQLTRVVTPGSSTAVVPGGMRPAGPQDRDLLTDWLGAFSREALGIDDPVETQVDRWLVAPQTRTIYVWDDGRPVSICGVPARWATGARIAPVYTPPELRRRGYASALVAAVSQGELNAGRSACYLFTDLANATSNHIYEAIGYEPVRDVDAYLFGDRPD
jgi:uncharacterized protein